MHIQQARSAYVISDIHGELRALHKLLRQHKLIDGHEHWSGESKVLWFLGDLVDRGHDSIGVLDLVMRLQEEAKAAGGEVHCLLGNHEMLLLAAYQFGRRSTGLSSNFITKWRRNGGHREDLAKLTKAHFDWLTALPAMATIASHLLIHADATFYTRYGRSVTEVNETLSNLLKRSDALAWEELLEEFAMRGIFNHSLAGEEFVSRFLTIFGGTCIIHGHTPITLMSKVPAKKVQEPWVYAHGRCINVDGGMFLGGPGVVHEIPLSQDTSVESPVDGFQLVERVNEELDKSQKIE